MKPMLASDYVESKLKFPLLLQPKIDGVRGLNIGGKFVGRSLKSHANKYVTNLFSLPEFDGFDGEIVAENPSHPDVCRLTTSALSTITGEPFIVWYLFDYVNEITKGFSYLDRMGMLSKKVDYLVENKHPLAAQLVVLRSEPVEDIGAFRRVVDHHLEFGLEGSIIRDPKGKHKQGRSTPTEGGLLRVKQFVDAEIVVTRIEEGEINNNEAQRNELGNQFRSSHKENMVASGMVGAIYGNLTKDVKDLSGKLLFSKGMEVKVGAGKMTHEERVNYFRNPELIIGKFAKFQLFPKGVKDKPRFPTFQTLRSESDL